MMRTKVNENKITLPFSLISIDYSVSVCDSRVEFTPGPTHAHAPHCRIHTGSWFFFSQPNLYPCVRRFERPIVVRLFIGTQRIR